MIIKNRKYQAYTLRNFLDLPQVKSSLTSKEINEIRVVGNVLPFKVNNYIVDELIDWNDLPNDPVFHLTFPQKEMLSSLHFQKMENAINGSYTKSELKSFANKIRYELNPHPAKQKDNIPALGINKLSGIQHKYNETVLFFPGNSQACHAYCTYCFRWPQFVGINELRFAMNETDLLIYYLKEHPEVTDILFTGGDPLVMSAKNLKKYIDPLLEANLPNLQNIRIGTKVLSYWPYRFIDDGDADDLLRLFEKIVNRGFHLAFMAHFSHPKELKTTAVEIAIKKILSTGAVIRTQSPIMNHINNSADIWVEMLNLQVKLGCIPYYMFVARDTGAQDYFSVTLENTWNIFRDAYKQVSGIARTIRGPIMSAYPGKLQILGVSEIANNKYFSLRFIQGRNPDWVGKPFFAKYNPDANWLTDLEPIEGQDRFFFEEGFKEK
ncbi:MAG TPA: lysine 2,3-aminomutase [Bacteroidales bacterium]|nr:lysine 2,3-aminomutase [Bacteroidales bacterium]